MPHTGVLRHAAKTEQGWLSQIHHQPGRQRRKKELGLLANRCCTCQKSKGQGRNLITASKRGLSPRCWVRMGRRSLCRICAAPSCWRTSLVSSSCLKYRIRSFTLSSERIKHRPVTPGHRSCPCPFVHSPLPIRTVRGIHQTSISVFPPDSSDERLPKQSGSLW